MGVAVVFIIFKRVDKAEKVFEVIRQAKPSKLFVIADGPRAEHVGEATKCEATRAIIDRVDWDCEVLKNYSDVNLGCGKRVASGLDWVFSHVEEAIILEDDCVVHPSFFAFCEELLEKYRYDKRIASISAQNVQLCNKRTEYSYYFSRYCHSWGWATWKRAWQNFDIDMKIWSEVKTQNLLPEILTDTQTLRYWDKIFQMTYEEHYNTWDYQWILSCWMQNSLSIIPHVNLVSNIGFDSDSTNTKIKDNKTVEMSVLVMEFPLKHPPFVIRNASADNFAQRIAFEGGWFKQFKASVRKAIKPKAHLRTSKN
jgi:hypothetical protein